MSWCLAFVTFWYFFYFIKSEYGGILASRLWKSSLLLYYFYLILIRLFHECFRCFLSSFDFKFNSLLLTFMSGVCSEIHFSLVSRFGEICYLTLMTIQRTGCHMMQGLGVENLEIYICICILYIYRYILLLSIFHCRVLNTNAEQYLFKFG